MKPPKTLFGQSIRIYNLNNKIDRNEKNFKNYNHIIGNIPIYVM
jgi:hypothetical protein